MQANIFSLDFVSNMNYIAELIRRMKIPVFILGAGAQSTIDYSEEAKDYLWRFYIKDNKYVSVK